MLASDRKTLFKYVSAEKALGLCHHLSLAIVFSLFITSASEPEERVWAIIQKPIELFGSRAFKMDQIQSVEWIHWIGNSSTLCVQGSISVACNAQFNVNNKSLILNLVTAEREGVYEEKVVWKDTSTTTYSVLLSVISLPSTPNITIINSSQSTLLLSCMATGSNLSYQWLKDGSVLESESHPTLQVKNVSREVFVTYTCQTSNPAGRTEWNYTFPDAIRYRDEPGLTQKSAIIVGVICVSLFGLCVVIIIICIPLWTGGRDQKIHTDNPLYVAVENQQVQLEPQEAVLPLTYVCANFRPSQIQAEHLQDFGYSTIE